MQMNQLDNRILDGFTEPLNLIVYYGLKNEAKCYFTLYLENIISKVIFALIKVIEVKGKLYLYEYYYYYDKSVKVYVDGDEMDYDLDLVDYLEEAIGRIHYNKPYDKIEEIKEKLKLVDLTKII